jgi:hypothetical protein
MKRRVYVAACIVLFIPSYFGFLCDIAMERLYFWQIDGEWPEEKTAWHRK